MSLPPEKGFEYIGREILESHEVTLERYNKSILSNILNSFPSLDDNSEILDFGAGVGTLAMIFMEMTNIKPITLEIDETQKAILRNRGFEVRNELTPGKDTFDLIYTSNVLEHIVDDLAVIKELSLCLKDSASRLVIYVPAFPFLFSDLDRAVDHVRRYTKKDLKQKLESCGLEVLKCHYADSLGFFATILIKLLGWKRSINLGSDRSIRFYDRFIFPISALLDKVVMRHILGKNVIAVSRTPSS